MKALRYLRFYFGFNRFHEKIPILTKGILESLQVSFNDPNHTPVTQHHNPQDPFDISIPTDAALITFKVVMDNNTKKLIGYWKESVNEKDIDAILLPLYEEDAEREEQLTRQQQHVSYLAIKYQRISAFELMAPIPARRPWNESSCAVNIVQSIVSIALYIYLL
jgi:hypothetical protein